MSVMKRLASLAIPLILALSLVLPTGCAGAGIVVNTTAANGLASTTGVVSATTSAKPENTTATAICTTTDPSG